MDNCSEISSTTDSEMRAKLDDFDNQFNQKHIKQTEQNKLDSYMTVGLSVLPVDTIVHVNVHVVD